MKRYCDKCSGGEMTRIAPIFISLGILLLIPVVTAPIGVALIVIGLFTRNDLVCNNSRCRHKAKITDY